MARPMPSGEPSDPKWSAHQALPLAPPATLQAGRFQLGRALGTGGMGEVRLAEDTLLHRKVAIKSVRADLGEDPEVRQRIARECQLHATVGPHPNIVTIYDRFEEAGQIRLVMEYVDGRTLQARLRAAGTRRAPIPLDEAADIAAQILDALAHIHANGIVHRDIKPSNIMLCGRERGGTVAKLMDFGIARRATDAALGNITQDDNASPGTPLYMAPEQIDPKAFGPVSPATDVYAMGIVLYHMLSGAPPFSGTITEIFNAHLNSKPSFNFEGIQPVPENFRSVLRRALAKRPDDRFESAAAFRQAVLRAAKPEPAYRPVQVTRRQEPVAGPRSARAARNRRRGGIVVAAAVALAMLGAWLPVTAYVVTRDPDRSLPRVAEPAPSPTSPTERVLDPAAAESPAFALFDDMPALPHDETVLESPNWEPVIISSVPLDTESFVIGESLPPATSNKPSTARDDIARANSEPTDPVTPAAAPRMVQAEPLQPIDAPITLPEPSIHATTDVPAADRVHAEPLPPPTRSAATYGFRVVGRESYRKQ